MLIHVVTTSMLRKCGYSWIDDFYDARAAFNSPEHEEMHGMIEEVAKKKNKALLDERLDMQLCEVHGCDGKDVLHPTGWNRQGDSIACFQFTQV